MGGYGSGRKFGANVTEDYHQIDIKRWQREGLLKPGNRFQTGWFRDGKKIAGIDVCVEPEHLRLIYNFRSSDSDSWESLDYPVTLQTTPCHYGGLRYWFICPTEGCGRRVAILYSAGKYFACRHCYQLAYQSQREGKGDRGHRGANKIRARLGWEPGIANLDIGKRKGMHWKTYLRLFQRHNQYVNQVYIEMMAVLKKVDARVADLERDL